MDIKNCKVHILTYGCSANKAESEMIAGLIEESGAEVIDSPDRADIVIVNTCVVKKPTETKILYKIKQLSASGKGLIIAGCMPEIRSKEIMRAAPRAVLLSTHNLRSIGEAIFALLSNEKRYFIGKSECSNIGLPRKRSSKNIAIVEISKGCMGECAYCSVKGVKGGLQSYPKEAITNEIKEALSEGCSEIWLTSQDCGCYGNDIGSSIVELMREIEKIPGNFRIRVGMMNPEHILSVLDELADCFKNERVYKFLHIPVQSGSDAVLRKMKRRYNTQEFFEIVSRFRKEIPNINIWTDLIVGFPEESDEDFNATVRLIEITKPGFSNISKFGAMKGTPAASMKQTDSTKINKRTSKLSELCVSVSLDKNKLEIGKTKEILINEIGKNGTLKGKDESFRQVVLHSKDLGPEYIGKIVRKKISSASPSGLIC